MKILSTLLAVLANALVTGFFTATVTVLSFFISVAVLSLLMFFTAGAAERERE